VVFVKKIFEYLQRAFAQQKGMEQLRIRPGALVGPLTCGLYKNARGNRPSKNFIISGRKKPRLHILTRARSDCAEKDGLNLYSLSFSRPMPSTLFFSRVFDTPPMFPKAGG